MKRARPYYLRALIIAACVAGLTVQANTYAAGPTIVHVTRQPYRPPVCKHGTVPDLNPKSFTYGTAVCR